MTYPFSSPDSYGGRRYVSAQFRSAPFSGPSRVILVAVNSDMLPPVFHEETVLQRMRVVSVPSDPPDELKKPTNFLPGVFKRPLPPMPLHQAPAMPRARLVRGEILHDNQGRMYEKTGTNIRPLHQLVSGPQGQVLELFPGAASERELRYAPASATPTDIVEDEGKAAHQYQEAQTEDVTEPPPLSSPPLRGRDERGYPANEPERDNPRRAPYRKIFPDPGQRRVVRLGDFKALLTAQLIHPERLRDSHWIPCYLQVYEACASQRLDSLAAVALGDPKLAWQLQLLSDALARRLGLAPLLKPRPPIAPGMRHPGDILPNERVFRLQVEGDPTADDSVTGDDNRLGNPGAARWTPMRAPASSAPVGDGLKKSIPERMIKPWEFRVTREEALYDMNVVKPLAGCLSLLARRLKGLIGGGGEMKKWRLLLSGKSADEQLWAVRPPSGGVSHTAIREWARKTLEAAGYDSQAMLLEWEIFWRRKGV
jgi:hypothetical protein